MVRWRNHIVGVVLLLASAVIFLFGQYANLSSSACAANSMNCTESVIPYIFSISLLVLGLFSFVLPQRAADNQQLTIPPEK